jgi:hypothetical protein
MNMTLHNLKKNFDWGHNKASIKNWVEKWRENETEFKENTSGEDFPASFYYTHNLSVGF